MSQAYRCDSCGEYHEGHPHLTLVDQAMELDGDRVISDLCKDCSKEFEKQFTLNTE